MTHDDMAMLTAGAALDDLEPDERVAFEAHLAGCRVCHELRDDLVDVLADLSLIVPERVPPDDLLAGIRSAISLEGPAQTDAARDARPSASSAPVSLDAARAARRDRRTGIAALGIAAAIALVAVGLGARTIGLEDELRQASARVAALEAQVSGQGGAVLAAANPDHVTVALHAEAEAPAATAMVMFVPGTSSAYLVARDLPATPAGHGYQAWYADAAGVHPLETETFDGNGPFIAPLDVDLASATAVMLTLEDSGGSRGEPGPQVVFGEL